MSIHLDAARKRTVEALLRTRATPEELAKWREDQSSLRTQVALISEALDAAKERIASLELEKKAAWHVPEDLVDRRAEDLLKDFIRHCRYEAYEDWKKARK